MSSQERSHEQGQAKSEENINTKDFLIGALIGGMVGAAAALFLAPKSGKELRTNINEQAGVIKEKTGQIRETAMSRGTQLAGAAKEKSNVLAQSVSKQSIELVNKVKNIKPIENLTASTEENKTAVSNHQGVNNDEVQKKLEETKKAFDETEYKYNH
ncbi:YtxH domain-containing protein [Bacillus sp. DTU_2020_1000418_1_SI_GHA_SEK_038]|uniref:YtxH domain-containing protein n=1 Tax=Bacillus sp. DTU_2020_1000418_1_SI_GHA_SEK_038 TaxID=3077585 RepID=UPI0028EE2385|nr:YtxH domain-containing protein [Bacillus sp. DTU_2020_1000418_1_SI_GHA_SEK_038]WNS74630.1 YtxH domain-containing protein [Bacillus sp. DTU_2020_1000418_1_SI_GHA_SEK_038]